MKSRRRKRGTDHHACMCSWRTVYGSSESQVMDVTLGMVIGLDYKNPYINPYREFQVSSVMYMLL